MLSLAMPCISQRANFLQDQAVWRSSSNQPDIFLTKASATEPPWKNLEKSSIMCRTEQPKLVESMDLALGSTSTPKLERIKYIEIEKSLPR